MSSSSTVTGRSPRRIRDQRLLDALERSNRKPYSGRVWRSVREGRDPLTCWRAGGRWDDGTLDVLYTSEIRATAIAERRFHLYQGQPLPPTKVRYELFELQVSLKEVVPFSDLESLASIGLNVGSFGQLSYLEREREYPRSQEIAEACAFLGADGLLVPSAREPSSNNLIIFCEQEMPVDMTVVAKHGYLTFQ